MSMKNSNDTIGNQSRDLPVCSAVPQPLRYRVPPGIQRENEIKFMKATQGFFLSGNNIHILHICTVGPIIILKLASPILIK
jgi:hypothetical protein